MPPRELRNNRKSATWLTTIYSSTPWRSFFSLAFHFKEAWQSGLMQHPAKMLYSKEYRRFESSRLRQESHFEKSRLEASAQSASAWYFSAILKAFLKSKTKVRSAMRKFEPIFLRKSRILSGFSC